MDNRDAHIESAIVNYLQGNLSEDEMKIMVSWINESEENKELFFRVKEIYDLRKGGLYPDTKEMDAGWKQLSAKIRNGRKEKAASAKKHLVRELYRYAAVAVIFVCLTLGIQYLFSGEEPVVYSELNMEAGVRMSHITLSDGTKVVLNASSVFKYPDRFGKERREVFLDGEAFFEVRRNGEIPFIVNTSRQIIHVPGTSFNVMDYSADDYAITTLVNGRIKLQVKDESGRSETEKIILKPGQQAFLDKTSERVTLSDIKIDPSRTWVNKLFHFRDEPLLRITQRMEKLYGVNIIIENEELVNEAYTGTFPLDVEIEEILKIINFDKRFTYTIKDEKITIQ